MMLTAGELAKEFRVSRDQVYRLARAGAIPGHKVGHEWRFRLSEVLEMTGHGQHKAKVVQPTMPRLPDD